MLFHPNFPAPTIFQATANSTDTTETCLARSGARSRNLNRSTAILLEKLDEARFIVGRYSKFGITTILGLKRETYYGDAVSNL